MSKKASSFPGGSPRSKARSAGSREESNICQDSCEKNHKIYCHFTSEIGKNDICENIHDISESYSFPNLSHPDCEQNHMRLNRALASAGLCSRRKADELIKSGKIRINGEVVDNPATRVSEADKIEYEGKPVQLSPPLVYALMNKPIHVVCTASDPQGRKTVIDLLPGALKSSRLFPVGRLDYFSEGLLLLTNDGELANRLMHPSHHLAKVYQVKIRGSVPEKAVAIMREGMELADGKKLAPVSARASALPNGDTILKMELRQGVNRQIRRMCDQLGLVILELKRVSEGSLELGDLPPGKTRLLSQKEVDALCRDVHLKR